MIAGHHVPPLITATKEAEAGGKFELSLGNLVRPCIKIKFNNKRVTGVAQR
jgi:hypothetical protein